MSRSRKAGGSVFGLALVAVLVFGAFAAGAAQASPKWHVNGKTLKELGISEAPIRTYADTVTIQFPWMTVKCVNNYGAGKIVGESSGTTQLKASSCSIIGAPNCKVNPITLNLSLSLSEGGKTGVIETFTPGYDVAKLVISGALCALNEFEEDLIYQSGNLAGEVGPESKILALTPLPANTIETAFSETVGYVSVSGSFSQDHAYGSNLGAW